jgi:hypothetical protein
MLDFKLGGNLRGAARCWISHGDEPGLRHKATDILSVSPAHRSHSEHADP